MPRRPADQPEDRFLRANLNDPDNQAALLRAYLDLKQTAESLAAQLAQAKEELARRQAAGAEAADRAREAGQRELAEKEAEVDRLTQALRLFQWAAERAGSAGSFLAGNPQDLGQVAATAASAAEAGGQLRYDKASDSWLIRWSDGRPETVVLPVPPKAPAPSPKEPRRKRGRSGR